MNAVDRENLKYSQGKINPWNASKHLLIDMLPSGGGKVIDVGCGEGSITAKIMGKGFDVLGLDFSINAVNRARLKGIKSQVCDIDEQGLPVTTSSVDAVWGSDSVEHLFDPIYFFSEVCRVLKPDGSLFLTIPNESNVQRLMRCLIKREAIQELTYRNCGQYKHHTAFSFSLLNYMLSSSNLRIKRFKAIVIFPLLHWQIVTKSKLLADLFGLTFVLEVVKE